MEKNKKWWLLATENEVGIEVDDNYYNHSQLFETSIPFWGTCDELVHHIQTHWFTQDEIASLQKGWQAYQKIAIKTKTRQMPWRWRGTFKEQYNEKEYVAWLYITRGWIKIGSPGYYDDGNTPLSAEEMADAPWLKHEVLIDANNEKLCLNFDEKYDRSWKDAAWAKTLRITCLDQDGCVNRMMAKSVIVKVGEFITELQSTIM